jgi:hypothetical protein
MRCLSDVETFVVAPAGFAHQRFGQPSDRADLVEQRLVVRPEIDDPASQHPRPGTFCQLPEVLADATGQPVLHRQ